MIYAKSFFSFFFVKISRNNRRTAGFAQHHNNDDHVYRVDERCHHEQYDHLGSSCPHSHHHHSSAAAICHLSSHATTLERRGNSKF